MNSFDFDVPQKDIDGAAHILRVGRHLIAAFMRKRKNEGLTKSEVARRLGVDKAVVSRMLSGNANLSLRTVGELCGAMDLQPIFICNDIDKHPMQNAPASVYAVASSHPTSVIKGNIRVTAQ